MDQRREFVLLAGLEGASVSSLCRRFGISRQTGYVWLRRFAAGEACAECSRRPHTSPRRTAAGVALAIVAERDAHPAWGARKIAHALRRGGLTTPAASTVHAVLRRHGRIDPPPGGERAWLRFERERPNALWQMDFKGRVRLSCGTWCHTLTAIDDHSRFALLLAACADERTQTVRQRLEPALRQHGLPEALYLDNGSPWGGGVPGQWTPLAVWLLKLGIRVIHARPYHPQGRGKNERFHRTLKAELFALAPLSGLAQAQKAMDDWRHVYNRDRPHQALGFATPASRYRPAPRSFPERLPEPEYDSGDTVRRVSTTKAYVSFKGRLWKIPQAFRGERVAIRPRMPDGNYGVFFGATRIAEINLNTPPRE